jgi:hypothetical protein
MEGLERNRPGVSEVLVRHCMEEVSRFPSVIQTGQIPDSLHDRTITASAHFVNTLVKIYGVNYLYNRSDQLDGIREPHFRRQHRQETCFYSPTETYGSNTAHCVRERGQRCLLAT